MNLVTPPPLSPIPSQPPPEQGESIDPPPLNSNESISSPLSPVAQRNSKMKHRSMILSSSSEDTSKESPPLESLYAGDTLMRSSPDM